MDDARWHARINEISDICNTTLIHDSMSREDIIDLFHRTLARIYELADYPPCETGSVDMTGWGAVPKGTFD